MNTNFTPTNPSIQNNLTIEDASRFFEFFETRIPWLDTYLIRVSKQNSKSNNLFDDCVFDHFGYRCDNHEHYQNLINSLILDKRVEAIHRSNINGREISIIKLREKMHPSLYFGGVQYFEICDQKPDGSQAVGFDHAELVYTKEPETFESTPTHTFFANRLSAEKEKKLRTGYKHPLHEIKSLYNGFRILISKGEFIWDVAMLESSNGFVYLEHG